MRCKNEANKKSFQNSESIQHSIVQYVVCSTKKNYTNKRKKMMYTHPQKVNNKT